MNKRVAACAWIVLVLGVSPAQARKPLAQCEARLLTCTSDLSESQANLAACQSDLAALGAGCDAALACPPPSDANHQTICGQLFDLENGAKWKATNAAGAKCTAPTADGPCSVNIVAYDAIAFGTNPASTPTLTSDPVYVDDCGRYRLTNIQVPAGPFVALAIDDADTAKRGPMGSTNTVAVATPKQGGLATLNIDGWVASKATTDTWENSGGPPVSGGLYIPVFHEMIEKTNRDLQDGVTFTRSGNLAPSQDDYFVTAESGRHTIEPTATATGFNGTALVTGATVSDLVIYSGIGGGLPAGCRWETHAGASLPFILWVQDFRPQNAFGQICDR
jgi:hypothetical protein